MTTKLTQRHLLKGIQEFEIVDDRINIRIKAPFAEAEVMTVMLTVLNPEPVISESYLSFNSRVNGEALVSLFLGKPNPEAFNAFVAEIKQKAQQEYNEFAGMRVAGQSPAAEANVFDEPPELENSVPEQSVKIRQKLDADKIEEAVRMLKQHLDEDDIGAFISALNSLKADPQNDALMANAISVFNELGPGQGAVLAYAPYVITILSDDPYNW